MGYQELNLELPTDYSEESLRRAIEKTLTTSQFTYEIENKSLDARKKSNIHWKIRVGVLSEAIGAGAPPSPVSLEIPRLKGNRKALVVGSGPAGFFAAYVLQSAGFDTVLIERGSTVSSRAEAIRVFESEGRFSPIGNYAFGEGGAGTFSDGKLTSRTKRIIKSKQFILETYINAGAPEEIKYLAHPHLGSDRLKGIVRNLRKQFINIGGTLKFETRLKELKVSEGRVRYAETTGGDIEADEFILATGHSAFDTYRMLMEKGIRFRVKNFALGCRVEHPQETINRAQWGVDLLPGVKAAEYRLTSKGGGHLPVYTFCMCPGGTIVPATAVEGSNIVNGMSRYRRNSHFANAACVAGVDLARLLNREIGALEALEWLETLESSFYKYSGYQAPFCHIRDFIHGRLTAKKTRTSYPLGLSAAPLWEMLPQKVGIALQEGLKDFSRKIKGFETGTILGLESKTSSPVQVLREEKGNCLGFENLYMAGEGSGHSGGIISSGVDGIRIAMAIIKSLT